MVALAGFCIVQFGPQAKQVYRPIRFLFACGISLITIQIFLHGEPKLADTHREFINWMLALVVVQSLSLRRRFFHRLALVLFAIGLLAIPNLSFHVGEVERARSGANLSGNLRNPNGLGEWFGYCVVYFAICGFYTRRVVIRIASWLIAIGCLFIVGLTVSRGSLLGCAVAITVGFRHILKRGFVPLLILILLTGVIYETGVFHEITGEYAERATEETGREKLWPDAIARLFASPLTPLIGLGVSNIGTDVLVPGDATPPHNAFLYFALSSGVVPLALYVVFWFQVARRSPSRNDTSANEEFRLPLLAFTFVIIMLGDLGFMSPWGVLAFSLAAGSGISHQISHPHFVRRRQGVRMLQRAPYPRCANVNGTQFTRRPEIARRRKLHPW
jgi:hypothetical protein